MCCTKNWSRSGFRIRNVLQIIFTCAPLHLIVGVESFYLQEDLAAGLQEEEELKRQEEDLQQRLTLFKGQEKKQ